MGHIQKRVLQGQTSWRARYLTPSGAERSKSFSRKIDAERFLTSLEAAKHTGTFVDPSLAKVTVASWAKTWLGGQAHLKASTYARYRGIVVNHIDPTWGHVELGKVTHADVQTWVTTLSRGQSAGSVRKIHRVLSLILGLAVKDGRLARNVAAGIRLPAATTGEKRYLSHREVAALAREIATPHGQSKFVPAAERDDSNGRLVTLFLAYTGVRWGEMAALRVGLLDLSRGRAVIAQSVTPVQGIGLVWGTPKNKKRREVPIPAFLVRELEQHITNKAQSDLVFRGTRGGEVMRVSTFRRRFALAGATIGYPGLHPHELRHTAASLAIAAGADVKVVQEMLGHATATMTMDTYGHLFKNRLDTVAAAMDAARSAELADVDDRAPNQSGGGDENDEGL